MGSFYFNLLLGNWIQALKKVIESFFSYFVASEKGESESSVRPGYCCLLTSRKEDL